MWINKKLTIGFVLVLLTGISAGVFFRRCEEPTKPSQVSEAELELGKVRTELGNAQAKVKELEESTQNLLKERNETLSMYARLEAEYKAKGSKVVRIEVPGPTIEVPVDLGLAPTRYYWTPDGQRLLSLGTELRIDFNDSRVKIESLFSSDGEGPTKAIAYELHLRLGLDFVQSYNKDGVLNHYAFLWEIDNKGNKIAPIPLTSGNVITKDFRQPQLIWWTPHVDIAGGLGWNGDIHPALNAGVSFSGYGITKDDLSWRFLRLGVNVGYEASLTFSPAAWNAGKPIPLLSNTWLIPYISYDLKLLGGGLLVGAVL